MHDSLPYIDAELDQEGYRDYVNYVVQEEMQRMRDEGTKICTSSSVLGPLPEAVNRDSAVGRYLKGMGNTYVKIGDSGIDMKRYDGTWIEPERSVGRTRPVHEWLDALKKLCVVLEYENLNVLNCELLQMYGVECWRKHMELVAVFKEKIETVLRAVEVEIQRVSLKRKNSQTAAGRTLSQLKTDYYQLVYRNAELERVCGELQTEVETS